MAVATIGGGVGGATTAALRADIVAFYQARGLFAGLSLDGSMISARSDWNQAYYGQPMGAQNIVIGMSGQNPGAQPLQEMLAQFAGQPEQRPLPAAAARLCARAAAAPAAGRRPGQHRARQHHVSATPLAAPPAGR